MKFVVPGRPVPAVRMTRRGKWVKKRAQRYLAYKDQVGWVARVAGIKRIGGPVKVSMTFYFANNQLPDVDNLVKAIMDGLNGIAWSDDRQVIRVEAERRKGEPERAEIEIMEVG